MRRKSNPCYSFLFPILPRSSLHLLAAICLIFSSCASTGPSISSAEIKANAETFNSKFFKASEKWIPKIYRVGYQLLKSPVPGHSSKEPKYNFAGVGVEELKKEYRKIYGVPENVKGVLARGVYPGSKAESIDLQPGDVIIKVDGKKTKNVGAYFSRVRKTKKQELKVEIWRKGATIEKTFPIEKVFYNAQFFLEPTPHFDAHSSFSKIAIGIGALRYCRSDDELAVIMGHELAHTTLHHSIKGVGGSLAAAVGFGAVAATINAVTYQGVGDLLVSPARQAAEAAVSRRYEREADYFGMKHAFHGGYNIKNGAKVFARLATDSPGMEILAYTFASHPKSPERFLRLEKIEEELRTEFPDKVPQPKPDWDVIIPVEEGETAEEAVNRLYEVSQQPVKVVPITIAAEAAPKL